MASWRRKTAPNTKILTLTNPIPFQASFFVDRFFCFLDTNSNGYVDMSELLNGARVLLSGTTSEKVNFVFTLFDMNSELNRISSPTLSLCLNLSPYLAGCLSVSAHLHLSVSINRTLSQSIRLCLNMSDHILLLLSNHPLFLFHFFLNSTTFFWFSCYAFSIIICSHPCLFYQH